MNEIMGLKILYRVRDIVGKEYFDKVLKELIDGKKLDMSYNTVTYKNSV